MIWIDYTIFAILFFSVLLGLNSDPVIQLLRIGCLLLSLFAGFFFYGFLSNFFVGIFPASITNLLSYFILFGFVCITTHIFADFLKHKTSNWDMGGWANFLGSLLGIVEGFLFCGAIIFGVLLFCSTTTCEKINNSVMAPPIGRFVQNIVSVIPEKVSNKTGICPETIHEQEMKKDTKLSKVEESNAYRQSR